MSRKTVLAFRRWDDELVVFDLEGGDTHLLKDLPADIFETILAAPHTLAELNTALSGRPESPDPDALAIQIDAAVTELRRLRLVA